MSLVYDNIPYENPILKGYPVFDIERIEVLRGPQGTLFGRNTPGGIIKFDSVKPTDEFDAYARGSYGTYNTFDLEGAIGGPLYEMLDVRLSAIHQSRDDYVDNAFTGEDDFAEGFEVSSARLQLLFKPTRAFSALLNIHGLSNDGSARVFRGNIIRQGQRGLIEDFDRDTVFFDGGGGNPLTQDSWGVNLTLEQELQGGWSLTYIYGNENTETLSRGDIDGAAIGSMGVLPAGAFNFPSDTSGGIDNLEQQTHEARIAYDDGGRLRGQGGVFVFDEAVTITSLSFAGEAVVSGARRSQDSNSYGVFGSLSYDLTERLTVAGGARYTEDEKDFIALRVAGAPLGPLRESVDDGQVSWDVSTTYRASEAVNVYGRIARGYRGPSVQGRIVFGDTLSTAQSETVLSYEVGAKSDLFDNRVRLNGNLFFYEVNDQQLTIVGGIDNTVALFNADKGEAYGFEADLEAVVTRNFLITAGVSYNNTQIKDDLLLSPGCGVPCTVLDPGVYNVADEIVEIAPGDPAPVGGAFLGYNISGNQFPNAPEWIGGFTARYAYPIEGGELYAYTDWAYKGDTNFFLYESVEFGQDGYWEGGLRLGYQSDRGYDVSVFGRNITNQDALTGAVDFTTFTGFVNEPQTFGVTLSMQY